MKNHLLYVLLVSIQHFIVYLIISILKAIHNGAIKNGEGGPIEVVIANGIQKY